MGGRSPGHCWLTALLVVALAACAVPSGVFGVLLFGAFLFLPSVVAGGDAVSKVLLLLGTLRAPVRLHRDRASRLCEVASLFHEHPKGIQVRTLENKLAFTAACRRALPSMDRAARAELERRMTEGSLWKTAVSLPSQPPRPFVADYRTCGAAWSRKTQAEVEGTARTILDRAGVLPLRERVVRASEVREALKRAEVVRFDGRSLLPARMFNVTFEELHAMHASHDIPVHVDMDGVHGLEAGACIVTLVTLTQALARAGPDSVLEWLLEQGLTRGVLSVNCGKFWTLKDVAGAINDFQRVGFHAGLTADEARDVNDRAKALARQGKVIFGSNINALRLPSWTRGDVEPQDLAEKIGAGGQVLHAHNLLWFGVSIGGIHLDIQDNVLVQVSGVSEVFVVPANCSLGFDLGIGNNPVNAEWIQKQGANLPFFLMRLEPGDAVAIPSNSMHVVASQDPKRIGMNFFMEPRHGRMRWPWAPANFYNYADRGHLAMRELWLQTIKEMWRDRDPASPTFVVHGQRQELA
mmetsp:Transcript_91004/g.281454  ORF Transcript_91004/g.281454 Transcript_91004/m.281454 type:complete len:523 (+) Transcript_91004:51-1619(+)